MQIVKLKKDIKCSSLISFLLLTSFLCLLASLIIRCQMITMLNIIYVVLFSLYVFEFYGKMKYTVIIPIILGAFGFNILLRFFFGGLPENTIFDMLVLLFAIPAVISALKGFRKKIFIIIDMSICIFSNAIIFVICFSWLEYGYITWWDVFSLYMGALGCISMYTALLIFCLKNKTPAVLLFKEEKAKTKSTNYEEELKHLRDKLEFGMITEEEYQVQRADIISKL